MNTALVVASIGLIVISVIGAGITCIGWIEYTEDRRRHQESTGGTQ